MNKNLSNLKNNKKLMNWLITTTLVIIIGISLILNIIFISSQQSKTNNTTTDITIDAVEGDPNSQNKTVFNDIEYVTIFSNLGDLIKNFTKRYKTQSYLGIGTLLTGVSEKNDGNFITNKDNKNWFIYFYAADKKAWVATTRGMDLLTLHNGQKYRLALHSW